MPVLRFGQATRRSVRPRARYFVAVALSVGLAANPGLALGADAFGGRDQVDRQGAFAGVRFRVQLPRASAPPPRLALTVGPTAQWETPDGVRQVRYSDGFTLSGQGVSSGRLALGAGRDCGASSDGSDRRGCGGGFPAWGYVVLAAGALALGYVAFAEACESTNCYNSD